MAGHPEGADLVELSVEECWRLIETRSIGRFALNRTGAGPLVVPVNYVIDGDHTLVFRSGAGTKLDSVGHGMAVIQVDEIDPLHRTGWSVVIEGTTSWQDEGHDRTVVETWAPGSRPYVVRLVAVVVTGRRIDLPQAGTDARGYR